MNEETRAAARAKHITHMKNMCRQNETPKGPKNRKLVSSRQICEINHINAMTLR